MSGSTSGQSANPSYDYSGASQNNSSYSQTQAAQNGQVIKITPGQTNEVIQGGGKQFVVEYTGNTTNAGGNTLTVTGGLNTFVVKYDFASDGSASNDGNNVVHVEGGGNQFVVAYDYTTTGGGTGSGTTSNDVVSGAGGAQVTGAATNDTSHGGNNVDVGGGNTVTINGDENAFVAANNFSASDGAAGSGNGNGGNSVVIDGGLNQFVTALNYDTVGSSTYDFGGASSGASGSAIGGGAFAPPSGSGASGGGASGDSASSGMGSAPGGAGGDLNSLLAQSPFGRLLTIPGVTAETLFGSLPQGGSSPFGNIAPGTNPFSTMGGAGGQPTGAGMGAPASANSTPAAPAYQMMASTSYA